ncbi:MAG: hypothetical protein OXH06_13215 [Gemmatimonadetes bacterium]|nr:hypothetical protein [Gemmatimonadota bacterium]MDE3259502.1 hypothetical protein [Gemmatimonadota bacterium]
MTQALAYPAATETDVVLIPCHALPARREDLSEHTMAQVSGGNPLLYAIVGGLVVVAATKPQDIVESVCWYGDRIMDGVNYVSDAYDQWTSGMADGLSNLSA